MEYWLNYISLLFVLQFLGLNVKAGEYCYRSGLYEYCSGYCCSTEDDACCSDWGWIAGVVVGVIVFLSIVGTIVFLVCHKMKTKKAQTVHVQMLNSHRNNQYQSTNTQRSSRRPNTQNNMLQTSNMQGNMYANTFLPPPPPYSQAYDQSVAYPPPPPYPGSPMPPSSNMASGGYGNHMQTTHMMSHTQASGEVAYPPPPVY